MKIRLEKKEQLFVKDIKIGQFFKITTNKNIYLRVSNTSNYKLTVVCFGSPNDTDICPQISSLSDNICVEEVYDHVEFTK